MPQHAQTDIGRHLRRAFEDLGQDGIEVSLLDVSNQCKKLMADIERTAKEVGGRPTMSSRYLEAREILSKLDSLHKLASGTYPFHLCADEDD